MQKKILLMAITLMTSSLVLADRYTSSRSNYNTNEYDEYNPHHYEGYGNRTENDYNNQPAPYHNPHQNRTEEDYNNEAFQHVEGD